MVDLINSGLYIPQSVSLSYMKVIHYGLQHEGVPEKYFLSNISEGEVLRTVEKYLYELRGFKMAEAQTQQLTEFDHNFNVGFVKLKFCIQPIIIFFIHEHNPFIFRIYLEIF